MHTTRILAALAAVLLAVTALAAREGRTQLDVAYGSHERQRMDLYLAPGVSVDDPGPVVVYFHGGGFRSGDKAKVSPRLIENMHAAGISVVSANYRYFRQAPLPAAMHDGARVVQFLRAHAATYGIDPERVAVTGSSAGAGIALWIAFHDDLADPTADDPVARASTRVCTAYVKGAQVSYDAAVWRELGLGKVLEGRSFSELFGTEDADALARATAEASPITHVSADDPPVRCDYSAAMAITDETAGSDLLHHPSHGVRLAEACARAGVRCEVYYPGVEAPEAGMSRYLIEALEAGCAPAAPLGGPAVDDAASRTVIQRGMSGRMATPESWPEVSAMAQLDIDQATRERTRAVVDEHARDLALALVDEMDLFVAISDATEAGERDEARDLMDDLWGRIDPERSRSPLLERLAALVSPEQADELKRMVDEYWEAALEQRLGKRRDRDKPATRRRVLHRLALERFTRDVRRAYDASLRRYHEAAEGIYAAVEPTDAQRDAIRGVIIEHIKRTRFEATPAQRRGAMLEIYRVLDEQRRERLFVYMTTVALPDEG